MKNIIRKGIFLTSLFVLLSILSVNTIYAGGTSSDGGCVPVYGGGVQCPRVGEVLIDKTVQNPATGAFVDNLGLSDPKYRPQQIINFRILVRNSGEQNLNVVRVSDKLPQYIDFMSGPGAYDAKTRTLTFDAVNLAGGTSQQFEIKARVVHSAMLPKEKKVVCPVNIADAVANNQTDRDDSQFCIEKKIEVQKVPSAGPENWLLTIVGLGTTLIGGFYLRKKAVIKL